MKTFEKNEISENFYNESYYKNIFTKLGFEPSSITISYANGASAYVSLSAQVLNEGKMYADMFTYNGLVTLQVRVSDHESNLERLCGGVDGNRLSFEAFKRIAKFLKQ